MSVRVMVVEDDQNIALLLSDILSLEGYEVSVRQDGAGLVGILATGMYDGVILDIMLPGTDGLTILREIRRTDGIDHLPVLMLTARVDPESTWTGWKSGCDYYMPKPFEPAELVEVLGRLLRP